MAKTQKQGNPGLTYTEKVIRRFRNPKHSKEMKCPTASGRMGNPVCGDVMHLFIKIKNGKIIDATFKTFGCVAAISTSDVLCEMVIGKTVKQAKKITNKDIIKRLGSLPAIKVHCSVLGTQALREAIKSYEKDLKKAKIKAKK